jgi:DNA polymerase/3'-5' exonuclease PolX
MSALLELALSLQATLTPACARIELAGSIRRGKPDPKDIELVAIPVLVPRRQALLFGGEANAGQDNLLEQAIARLVAGDEWEFDPVVKRNGPRYKRLRHRESLAACDLFITDCRCWAVIYALRTGPSDFSKALVSRALGMGMFVEEGLLHGHRRVYGKDDKPLPCPRGAACSLIIPTPEEEDFFRSLKLPVWSPAKRSLARLMNDFRGGKP